MIEYRWNGVGLNTPDQWEPSALERDGFLLEQEGRPRCELKWRTVQGTFSFEKHMKKLARGHKDVDMQSVPLEATPEGWQQAALGLAESGILIHSFIWQIHGHKGIGAALHNPATGLAVLIQFFVRDDQDAGQVAEVLASFRDYSSGKTMPWAMFGLQARTPADFRLNTFSFKPGSYTVSFWRPKKDRGDRIPAGKGPGTALVFERFAPASVLLRETGLEQWVRDMKDGPASSMELAVDHNMVEWVGASKSSLLRRALGREVISVGRVWTTGSGNAILVVRAEGVLPITQDEFTRICESYELV